MSGPLTAAPNSRAVGPIDSGDEMGGDAHHANEADDGCKRQGFAGQADHVNNSGKQGCRFVLVHGMFRVKGAHKGVVSQKELSRKFVPTIFLLNRISEGKLVTGPCTATTTLTFPDSEFTICSLMTDASTSPALPVIPAKAGTPCPADEADWARGFAMRQLHMLGELAELGLDVARAVERQASDPAAAQVVQGDVALAYARVSRAVRLTLMLQARLIEDLKASDRAGAEARPEPDRFSPEYQRKVRVERIVERLAEAEHPDAEDTVDDLIREAGERLDDEDLYGDLMERPLSELVARLCKDIGLDPDWAELAGELWAVQEVESGHVGWPLARPPPAAESEKDILRRALGQLDAAERAYPSDTG